MNRTKFSHYFSFLIAVSIKVVEILGRILPDSCKGETNKEELLDENITESYRNNATEISQKCY